jgi:Ty3 transposon capsid-like protein
MKLPKAEPFSGKRSRLQGFLTKMQLHLAANSMFLRTDVDRIKFVGTYLEGVAYDWFEPYLRDYLENGEIRDETSGMFQSYTSFVKRLQAVFGDLEAERTAER